MNQTDFSRTELLIGTEAFHRLQQTCVAVVGLGGVGSYAAEALVRAGIGSFILIDFDTVGPSNLNRQVIATHASIGQAKTKEMAARILDINPQAKIITHQEFIDEVNREEMLNGADFIIDAIDSLNPKIGLLEFLARTEKRFIAVMGAGNKLDPTQIQLSTLDKSHNCPLARRVRKFLSKRGINGNFPCVYSVELPRKQDEEIESPAEQILSRGRPRTTIGSISYMPAVMGMIAASWVVNSAIETIEENLT